MMILGTPSWGREGRFGGWNWTHPGAFREQLEGAGDCTIRLALWACPDYYIVESLRLGGASTQSQTLSHTHTSPGPLHHDHHHDAAAAASEVTSHWPLASGRGACPCLRVIMDGSLHRRATHWHQYHCLTQVTPEIAVELLAAQRVTPAVSGIPTMYST